MRREPVFCATVVRASCGLVQMMSANESQARKTRRSDDCHKCHGRRAVQARMSANTPAPALRLVHGLCFESGGELPAKLSGQIKPISYLKASTAEVRIA